MNEELEKAYNLVSKYGISLNSFGPFLSYIDNKVGLCISLREKSYGILTRNVSFDNLEDFESFLKRYTNFKNAGGHPSITFDNYEICNPMFTFSNEISSDKEESIKSSNISILKECLNSFKDYFSDLFNYRLVKLQKREKSLVNASYALNEYKKNLYSYYGKEYKFEEYQSDDVINKFEDKYNKFSGLFRNVEDHLFDEYNLEQINNDFLTLINLIKEFELDKDYFDNVFDMSICQNRLIILDEMNKLVLGKLELTGEKDYEQLKVELDSVKEKNPFLDKKDSYISSKMNEIEDKYSNFDDSRYFNFINYINKKDYVSLTEFVDDDYDTVDRIDGVDNDDTILLYSPLRTIMSHILLDISINKNDSDYSEYLPIYNELKEKSELPVNVLVVQKYFKDVNFDAFNSFIDSLKIVCNKIYNLDKKYDYELIDDEMVYSYDFNSNYLFCTNKIIKDSENDVAVLKLYKGTKVFYNSKKIIVNPKDNNNLIVIKNDDYIIDSRINTMSKISDEVIVNDYSVNKEKIRINNNLVTVVIGINLSKTYHYKNLEIK